MQPTATPKPVRAVRTTRSGAVSPRCTTRLLQPLGLLAQAQAALHSNIPLSSPCQTGAAPAVSDQR